MRYLCQLRVTLLRLRGREKTLIGRALLPGSLDQCIDLLRLAHLKRTGSELSLLLCPLACPRGWPCNTAYHLVLLSQCGRAKCCMADSSRPNGVSCCLCVAGGHVLSMHAMGVVTTLGIHTESLGNDLALGCTLAKVPAAYSGLVALGLARLHQRDRLAGLRRG